MELERFEATERAFARMIRADYRANPGYVDHVSYFMRVLSVVAGDDVKDETALILLSECEIAGIQFETARNFRSFYDGLRQRIDPDRKGIHASHSSHIAYLLKSHTEHLPPSVLKEIADPNVLLTGLDLFADGDGTVPLCKTLRIAAGCARQKIGWTDTYRLCRIFSWDRADDVIGILECDRARKPSIERILSRPERVGASSYGELIIQLSS